MSAREQLFLIESGAPVDSFSPARQQEARDNLAARAAETQRKMHEARRRLAKIDPTQDELTPAELILRTYVTGTDRELLVAQLSALAVNLGESPEFWSPIDRASEEGYLWPDEVETIRARHRL